MNLVVPLRIVVIAGSLGLLELSCRVGWADRKTIIPPTEMLESMIEQLRTPTVLAGIGQTLGNVLAALVMSVVVGFLVGVIVHSIPRLRRTLDPLLATFYAVPFFVFYPVMIGIFGLTQWPIIVTAFLFAMVAMLIATLTGIDRIPRVLSKVARTHRMGVLETAIKLKLPAAAPHLFGGVKLCVANAFIGVIASEFIMATSGIGYEIGYAYNNFENRRMYGLMLFVLVLVVTVNMALHSYEQRLARRRAGR
ncbi:MAG: ABC transporter permease [Alphaproteobacteria bacterium]